MRAGVCVANQTLSAESASVLTHCVALARRRGHAQVTPLHVAATLLTSRASLLRAACLKSKPNHQPSIPHQCRALELCFNVALNRLPAAPGPLHQGQPPSLSNALIAALKRAHAHQRRGCIEHHHHQQQPFLAVKVDLEQLILSILDDPSVSRVMKEAGFSSTIVKDNLEDSCYNSISPIFPFWGESIINPTYWNSPNFSDHNPNSKFPFLKDDVKSVLEVLVKKKRRNTVIVGDSSSMAEALVAELMSKVEKGDVPEELKSAYLLKFRLPSFTRREEVELNVNELKKKVESCASSSAFGRVIIYIGDLQWAVDEGLESCGYSCVDYLVAEIGKLISWYSCSSNIRVWLMATMNYHTYIKWQMKKPPLDVQWALQFVTVPSAGLGLSLNATSGLDSQNPRLLVPEARYEKESQPLPYLLKSQIIDKDELWRNNSYTSCRSNSLSMRNPFASSLPRFRRSHRSCHSEETEITLALGSHVSDDGWRSKLGNILKENVPWQSKSIPLILDALDVSEEINNDKFLLIQGNDVVGKRRLALGIAKSLFGSSDLLFPINLRNHTNTREFLENVLRNHKDVVILIEAVEFSDPEFAKFLEEGNLNSWKRHNRDPSGHAIFILTTDGDAASLNSIIQMKLVVQKNPNDLDWETPIRTGKRLRSDETEEVSSTWLDLNVRANEEESDEAGEGQFSPITSDVTTEQQRSPLGFLNKIKNCVFLNRNWEQDLEAREMLVSKMRRWDCEVEEGVMDEILKGCGFYLNGVFDSWVKDIFHESVKMVRDRVRVRVRVRVCLDGKSRGDGYMGTTLPETIPLSFLG